MASHPCFGATVTQSVLPDGLVRLNLDWFEDIVKIPKGFTIFNQEHIVTDHRISEDVEDKWLENYRLNKGLGEMLPYGQARDRSNKTAILIGGSPALHRNLDHLNGLEDDFVIIPCNTSLPPVLEAGITPDFVFAVEGRDHIYNDMDCKRDDLTLIASPFISHKTLQNWKGPVRYFFMGGGDKWDPELRKDIEGKHDVEISGGNVISCAMLWAYKFLKIRHFIFTGMSLCYYGQYYHDGRSIPQIEDEKEKTTWINVVDMYGALAKSTYPLILYKQWLESYTRYIIQYGGSITNATEDGILGVIPEITAVNGTKVSFQPVFLPWINIAPLDVAIKLHRARMEAQK
jgi:hypothetical protein